MTGGASEKKTRRQKAEARKVKRKKNGGEGVASCGQGLRFLNKSARRWWICPTA